MASKFATEDKLIYTEICNLDGCNRPASKKCAGCFLVFYCGQDHQKLDWMIHRQKCLHFLTEIVKGIGRCLIARQNIADGSDILKEQPLQVFNELDFMRNDLTTVLSAAGAFPCTCIVCDNGKVDLVAPHFCSKCKIPLCSVECEKNILHALQECEALQEIKTKENRPVERAGDITHDVNILRVLMKMKSSSNSRKVILEMIEQDRVKRTKDRSELQENDAEIEHLFPLSCKYAQECIIRTKLNGIRSNVDLVRSIHFVLKVFGGTVKNSTGQKALYDKQYLVSHSCIPNCEMWIDFSESYYKLFVRTKCAIKAGEKITVCMDESLLNLPTAERRKILFDDYNIDCSCLRCSDASECKLFVSGYRCSFSKCQGGYMVPKDPFNPNSDWKCQFKNCKNSCSCLEMSEKINKLQKELEAACKYESTTLEKLAQFIQSYRGIVLHPNHTLIQCATTRLGQIATYFLGGGGKLVLCVISEFKNAYKLCELKHEYVLHLIKLHEKFKVGYKEEWGKLQYELGCITLALKLAKFKNSKFKQPVREVVETVQKVYATFKSSVKTLNQCTGSLDKAWIEDAKDFASILFDNFKPIITNMKLSNDEVISGCNSVLSKWSLIATDIKLENEFRDPESPVTLGGKTILELLMSSDSSD